MKSLQESTTFEMSPLSLSFTSIPLTNHMSSEGLRELELSTLDVFSEKDHEEVFVCSES